MLNLLVYKFAVHAMEYIRRTSSIRDGHGPEPDSEPKIWRLTGFGSGSEVLVFGAGFGVNFSDSAHLCCVINKVLLV